ncbi:MAG: hypothetical protein QOJ57_1366 [Thermoleophilaceae bacterium]|nr:hypothetical protein [Thermoleophilaceae bacterium]
MQVEAPDLIQPVAAFRVWRVVDGRLWSPHVDVAWTEPVQRARCRRPVRDAPGPSAPLPHAAPHPECGCGIYAYHELVPRLRATFQVPGFVLGIVSVWGEIQAYAEGLRSEYARVRAIAYLGGWGGPANRDRRRAAAGLDADLVEYPDLELAARGYGGPLPAALLP